MARIQKQVYVTRTVKFTTATVKGMLVSEDKPEERTMKFFGEPEDSEIKLCMTTDNYVPYKVTAKTVRSEKRRIKFEDFMTYSEPCKDDSEDDVEE